MKLLAFFTALMTAVSLSGLVPFERHEVAALQPVQALTVSVENGRIVLDGGQVQGRGATWQDAMADLRHSGKGAVFLGTAEQIILVQSAVQLLPQVLSDRQLRPAAQVCVSRERITDVQAAADYLSAHPTGMTVQKLRTIIANAGSASLPVLTQTEGGLRIYGS